MQDHKNEILDEPEIPEPIKPNQKALLKGLGIPLGFMLGAGANFMNWTLVVMMRFVANGTNSDVVLIILFILFNITAILFLIFSLYKYHKPKFLLLNGFLSYFTGVILYIEIITEERWSKVLFETTEVYLYSTLPMLILGLLILIAWIMIIKQKKRALGIILLMIVLISIMVLE